MPDDGEDRQKRLRDLIRENVKKKGGPKSTRSVSVNGNHNVVVMRGAKIVVAAPPPKSPYANGHANGKTNGKKKSVWREELEGLIWQRVWDLAMTTDQFYELATKKLRAPVLNLSKVSERELGVLYEMLAAMRRPALGR